MSTEAANLFNVNGIVAVVTGGGSGKPFQSLYSIPKQNSNTSQDWA
jgi:hypothetical protein